MNENIPLTAELKLSFWVLEGTAYLECDQEDWLYVKEVLRRHMLEYTLVKQEDGRMFFGLGVQDYGYVAREITKAIT